MTLSALLRVAGTLVRWLLWCGAAVLVTGFVTGFVTAGYRRDGEALAGLAILAGLSALIASGLWRAQARRRGDQTATTDRSWRGLSAEAEPVMADHRRGHLAEEDAQGKAGTAPGRIPARRRALGWALGLTAAVLGFVLADHHPLAGLLIAGPMGLAGLMLLGMIEWAEPDDDLFIM